MMDELISRLQSFGLNADSPILDNNIQRVAFRGSRDLRGWYVGSNLNGNIYCTYGSWDELETHKFTNNGVDSVEANAQWKFLAEIRRKQKERDQKRAAIKAEKIIESAPVCPADHPYLVAKGIKPVAGTKFEKKTGAILVPMYEKDGAITSLQRIFPDGTKKMLYNGKKQGSCFVIHGRVDEAVCICEGLATGASINEATGYKVLVAFDIGNLKHVAMLAADRFPKIIVCADNDWTKKKNVGLTQAHEVAQEIGAMVRFPEGIEGSDFNDLHQEKGLGAVREAIKKFQLAQVLSKEDIEEQDNLTLKIPDHILNPGGLIKKGLESLSGPGLPPIPQYNVPVVLATIARAISGRCTLHGVWPNLYNIKVGPTSSGKSSSDNAMVDGIYSTNAGLFDFYGPNDIASGPALLRTLSESPRTLLVLDEATSLFRRYDKHDPISDGKLDVFLEIHSKAGKVYRRAYSDSKNNVEIINPCLSIIGNATPVVFDSIKAEDFHTGTMQRFDFWCYDGAIPERGVALSRNNPAMTEFVEGVVALYKVEMPGNVQSFTGTPVELSLSAEAAEKVVGWSRKVVSDCNTETEDGMRGILSRRYDLALRYAMVHHASINQSSYLEKNVSGKSVEWGIMAADMLAQWKIKSLYSRVTTGDFHRDCETFKQAIIGAIKMGKRPTFKTLANRRLAMKNWNKMYSSSVIEVLVKREEIVVDESKRTTAYFLPKEDGSDI